MFHQNSPKSHSFLRCRVPHYHYCFIKIHLSHVHSYGVVIGSGDFPEGTRWVQTSLISRWGAWRCPLPQVPQRHQLAVFAVAHWVVAAHIWTRLTSTQRRRHAIQWSNHRDSWLLESRSGGASGQPSRINYFSTSISKSVSRKLTPYSQLSDWISFLTTSSLEGFTSISSSSSVEFRFVVTVGWL